MRFKVQTSYKSSVVPFFLILKSEKKFAITISVYCSVNKSQPKKFCKIIKISILFMALCMKYLKLNKNWKSEMRFPQPPRHGLYKLFRKFSLSWFICKVNSFVYCAVAGQTLIDMSSTQEIKEIIRECRTNLGKYTYFSTGAECFVSTFYWVYLNKPSKNTGFLPPLLYFKLLRKPRNNLL